MMSDFFNLSFDLFNFLLNLFNSSLDFFDLLFNFFVPLSCARSHGHPWHAASPSGSRGAEEPAVVIDVVVEPHRTGS
jgi:hypothetical protein